MFIDFVRKNTTVQRFSLILYEKARQYNDFHRFCTKKPDSTTIFIDFVRKTRQYNGFHCVSTTTHLPSQTRCLALPSSRPSAIRPSLPIPNDRKTLCFRRFFKKMTEKPDVFAGISPKCCVFLSFGMGSDRHIHPFGAPDPKYVRRFPSQMTEKPYDFALFCPKRTTVQRFSSILYEKARQYNKFHRSCVKKYDSTTNFFNFV